MDGNALNSGQQDIKITLEELVPELQNQISSLMLELTASRIVVKKLHNKIAELEAGSIKTSNDF